MKKYISKGIFFVIILTIATIGLMSCEDEVIKKAEGAADILAKCENFDYSTLPKVNSQDSITITADNKDEYSKTLTSADSKCLFIYDGVSTIGVSAFENNNLMSVTIPNSVRTISNFAFANNNLTSVSIPSAVTSIKIESFLYNPFTSVIMSEDLYEKIKQNIYNIFEFVGNYSVKVSQESTESLEQGISVSYKATEYYNITNGELRINEGVTVIATQGFRFIRHNLTSVIIPSSVLNIGESAFYGNSVKITSVTISNDLYKKINIKNIFEDSSAITFMDHSGNTLTSQ